MTTELVERAQRGDHEAFDALATAAYHRLYAIARRILRDGYAAEDAVQDALIRAWRDLRGLRDRERFDAWLHRLLINACADQARRSRRRRLEITVDLIDRPDRCRRSRPGRRSRTDRAGIPRIDRRAPLGARPHALRRPAGRRGRRDPRHPDRHGLLTPPQRQSSDAGLTGPADLDAAHRLGARTMNESMDRALADWLREGPEYGSREVARARPRRDPSNAAATGVDLP